MIDFISNKNLVLIVFITIMHRNTIQVDNYQMPLTPSKRQKYDSYTPRKRYVKEQEELNQYRHLTFNEHQPTSPVQYPEELPSLNRSRHLPKSNHKENSGPVEEPANYRSR